MSEYLSSIKKVFSNIDSSVIVFKNYSSMVWQNNCEMIYNINEINYDCVKLSDLKNKKNSSVELYTNEMIYTGKCTEYFEKDDIYSLIILNTEDPIMKMYNDESFVDFIQQQDSYTNLSVTEISAYINLIKTDDSINENIKLYCEKILLNCLRLLRRVKENSQIISSSNSKKIENVNIKLLIENIINEFSFSKTSKINYENLNRLAFYTKCNKEVLYYFLINMIRQIMLKSVSKEIKITSQCDEKIATITMISDYSDKDDKTEFNKNFMVFDFDKYIINILSNKLKDLCRVERKYENENYKIIIKIKITNDIENKFESSFSKNKTQLFSTTNIMLSDCYDENF